MTYFLPCPWLGSPCRVLCSVSLRGTGSPSVEKEDGYRTWSVGVSSTGRNLRKTSSISITRTPKSQGSEAKSRDPVWVMVTDVSGGN